MCGLFGVMGKRPIAESIYHGIIQLQHRGQDAAGIFVYDPIEGRYTFHKDLGLVKDIFTTDSLSLPEASWGIGHVRYSTIGKVRKEDTQPLHQTVLNRTFAIAHNGNIVNYIPLKKALETKGASFESTSDAEVLLEIFSKALPEKNVQYEDICHAVKAVQSQALGAYSVIILITGVGMVAFRDPMGIRPLLFGHREEDSSFAFGSENNALTVFGCQHISDVAPGEAVFIDATLKKHRKKLSSCNPAYCSFEYDYFSKPNTMINGHEVYTTRSHLGRSLAKKIKSSGIKIDAVVPIPTTARAAAISLAKELGVDYQEGFVKQDNIGRTFIMPTQKTRQIALSRKLAPVFSVFKGKSVLLVDDSIVRGTVSKRVVALARWAGAEKVYFSSTYPPIRHPCLYGVDFPNRDQLIAAEKSIDQISAEIDADGLFYNENDALQEAIGTKNLCNACLTGKYPTEMHGKEELQSLRQKDLKELEVSWS